MSKTSLACQTRNQLGKAASRRMRLHQSMAPAVIYGNKQENLHVMIDEKKLYHACEEESFFSQVLQLDVDGTSVDVVVRQVQRHPYKQKVMHIDFLRVSQETEITLSIPLHFENAENCIGVKQQGGTIFHELNEVEIMCLPKDLPTHISVDVTNLEVGSSLHLSDLPVPEGVSITELEKGEEHNVAVVRVSKAAGSVEEDEAEEDEAKDADSEERE